MDRRSFSDTDGGPRGAVYWVTGLPGVGKKTLAAALADRLEASGRRVVRLTGDGLREILGGRYSYGQADRHVLAQVYGRLCEHLSRQGHDVVLATVSLFHDVHGWNRAHIPIYREIYLRASPETLAKRHPKGLHAAGLAGRVKNVPGIDLPIEEPSAAEVVIEDDGGRSAADIADEVFHRLDALAAAVDAPPERSKPDPSAHQPRGAA